MQSKLYIVVNEDTFFLSHRKEVALIAMKVGYDVTIVSKDTGKKREIESLGLKMIDFPINPTGKNILQELLTFIFLFKLYKRNCTSIVHHVGLKNILWGGLAAKLTGVKGVVNAVTGLGILFSQENISLLSRLVLSILRFSHNRKNVKVIFQNHEDESLFLKYHIVKNENVIFIKGSGVDLNQFVYQPELSDSIIKVIFSGRMLREKGPLVLIEAALLLQSEYKDRVQFLLCGGLSKNPKAIKEKDLLCHCDGNYIQWLGYREDIKTLLIRSHIVVYPSYYREGVPKSLIEAVAIGRPIITTNSIGCRDTVEDGINGFLIPIKDSKALAEKLRILIDNAELRNVMGMNSRKIAERYFSINDVLTKHLKIYNNLEAK